jgi:VRR-NUC domain
MARRRKPSAINYGKLSETDIHMAIADLLRRAASPGVSWFHPANGELRNIRTAARLKKMGVRPGIPDLMITINGRMHGLELKTTKGRTSPAQIAMHDEMRASGVVIEIAHGIQAAVDVLRRWGAIRLASSPSSAPAMLAKPKAVRQRRERQTAMSF